MTVATSDARDLENLGLAPPSGANTFLSQNHSSPKRCPLPHLYPVLPPFPPPLTAELPLPPAAVPAAATGAPVSLTPPPLPGVAPSTFPPLARKAYPPPVRYVDGAPPAGPPGAGAVARRFERNAGGERNPKRRPPFWPG